MKGLTLWRLPVHGRVSVRLIRADIPFGATGLTYGYPVRAYAYNGTSATNLVRPAYGSWSNPDASLSLANIDGDAQLELLWTTMRERGTDTEVRWPRVQAWDLTTSTTGAQAWTSYRGVMQVKHPHGAVVYYGVGTNLSRKTTLGWGEQFTVPANQDVKLRVVTTSATDVTVDWW